jgi:hypothetical protein
MKRLFQQKSGRFSHRRSMACATASAATALGRATSARAEIHYSSVVNKELDSSRRLIQQRHLSLSDGAVLHFAQFGTNSFYGSLFDVRGAALSNQFRGYVNSVSLPVARLASGRVISQGHFFEATKGDGGFLGSSYGAGEFSNKGGFIQTARDFPIPIVERSGG